MLSVKGLGACCSSGVKPEQPEDALLASQCTSNTSISFTQTNPCSRENGGRSYAAAA